MNSDEAQTIYTEYMLHARHIEQQRQLFAMIFTAVFGGLLGFVASQTDSEAYQQTVFTFLALFAAFGYLITAIWNVAFVRFTRLAEHVAIAYLHLPDDLRRFAKHKKLVSASRIFIGFYCLMIGLSTSMSLSHFLTGTLQIITMVMIAFGLLGLYVFWFGGQMRSVDSSHKEFSSQHEIGN